MSEINPSVERRRLTDRRSRPTPMFSRFLVTGRRQAFRREEEERNAYVDRYGGRILALLTAIAGLSILDALFTLLYLQRGGSELNPLMAAAIDLGIMPFLTVKSGLTFAGLLFLCLHKNFRWVRGALVAVLVIYVLLFGYHVYLAFRIPDPF